MIVHAKRSLLLALAGFGVAFGAHAEDLGRVPVPYDWSHRHLIFSKPDTPAEAIQKGTFEQWRKNYRDPRFVLALQRRMEREADAKAVAAGAPAASSAKATRGGVPVPPSPPPSTRPSVEKPLSTRGAIPVHRDWSNVMGGAAGVGSPGIFPAKYNFDISATPSCANDFVVFPTSAAGVNGSGAFASRTGTVTGNFSTGATRTVTITNGTRVLTLTSSAGTNTGLFFQDTGSNTVQATNLANAIARNGGTVGVTATSAAGVVTVTAITQGTGANSIALAENLGGFAWAGGTLAGGSGTAGQATIFALNQIYSSCGTATQGFPDTLWAYNTGSGAVVDSSPILSLDGTQVAFIQRSPCCVASLVMLKWAASSTATVGAPTTPTSVAAGSYRACAAPCMTSIALSGNPNNTNSAPYYFYETDELWVGDDAGVLHKFTGVFIGTPAESGAPWPVTVNAGRILSPPVYDSSTNLVFVGSKREPTTTTGGRLHSVNNATGAVITSGLLAGNPTGNLGSTGVAEAVIVDQLAQRVYTFVATDPSGDCSTVECHAVYQFATNASIAGLTAPRTILGRGQIYTRVMYAGIFDDAYYSSADPANPSGFLYACGSNGGGFATSRRPTLWRIPITNNVMGTAVIGPSLVAADTSDASGGGGVCSPITDIQNGANNYIYVSVPEQGNQTGCAGSCIYVFNLTGITVANWPTRTAVDGLVAPGGTSGIVIDNTSSVVGASQVYFSTLTSPGNAIQASQAGLN